MKCSVLIARIVQKVLVKFEDFYLSRWYKYAPCCFIPSLSEGCLWYPRQYVTAIWAIRLLSCSAKRYSEAPVCDAKDFHFCGRYYWQPSRNDFYRWGCVQFSISYKPGCFGFCFMHHRISFVKKCNRFLCTFDCASI